MASWPSVLVRVSQYYPQNTHYSAVAYPAAERAMLAAVEERNWRMGSPAVAEVEGA